MKDLADEIQALADRINNPENSDEEVLEICATMVEKLTEFRNRLAKKMKYSSPTKQRILRLQVIDIENQIEQYKQKIKTFREACEKEARTIAEQGEELDELFEQTDLQVAKMYIIAKHQMPKDFFDGLHASIVDNLTPELVQEFYERVAHLEATQLEDILAGK
jgi:chromosome segregation ATPase